MDLRLAWLTENHPPAGGGMARSGDRIVGGLRGLGVEIDVYHFCPRLQRWEQRQQDRGRYYSCPVHGDPAHALNRVWSGMEAEGRDYSHVLAFGGSLPLQAGPVFSAWLQRPLLTLIRGNDFDAAVFNPRRAPVLAQALQCSARVCCVSRDKLRKIGALFPGVETDWLPNGIDMGAWQARSFDLDRARQWREAFVVEGRLVLGLFGHLKAKKGLLFFLECLLRSGLRDRFYLLLVGDITPDAAGWLEQREEELSFTLLPFLDPYDLIPYYSACDYAVLPSFYDGMPNTMLEAMALGVPLIAAKTGGMADVLEDGRHGFLFPPGDVHACRRAITRAAGLEECDRVSQAQACRVRCGDFTVHRESQAYLQVLQETLKGRKPVPVMSALPGATGVSTIMDDKQACGVIR